MTIDPPPAARRWGMAALTVCHTPVRLTSIMSCQACSVRSSARPKLTIPALAHHDVEPAEPGHAVGERRLQRVVVADVDLRGDDPPVERLDRLDRLGQVVRYRHRVRDGVDLRGDVDGDDVGALFGEPHRVTAALTPGDPGDEGDLSL